MTRWTPPRVARFVAALLAGLALLTATGYVAIRETTRRWFEHDLQLRSRLAVTAASQGLVGDWVTDRRALTATLDDITRDERIMGAAACAMDGATVARTAGYPLEFPCGAALLAMRDGSGPEWSGTRDLPSGRVHVSAITVGEPPDVRGVIVLVHDLRFLERRDATTRNLLLAAFFVLAFGGSLVTVLAARFAWTEWTTGLRRALRGDDTPAFRPLVRDVRELMDRIAREAGALDRTGPWTAQRLHSVLKEHLEGERVVILANREPYIHQREAGAVTVQHPASGLVTALEPVMRACSGVWVAHGSGTADRETVDRDDHVRVPPGEESYVLRRVWLSEAEEAGYYYGFSNEGLWPLCHLAHARPLFRAADWRHYVAVNQRFADAVCQEVDSNDPIVLVQDYHFALAPRMIRERLPRATILTFWHIPWPNDERFGICPWREEIIAGLLGSSILGFQTRQHCNNFIDAIDAFVESRIDREVGAIVQGARRTLVRAYPISIEWPVHWLGQLPDAPACRAAVRQELGLPPSALLGVGVDRLDYTKGIEERLLTVDMLLEHHEEYRGLFTFVQVAAPSRTKIERYRDLNDRVVELANAINARWGSPGYRPIILKRAHHEPPAVFTYYRAADLCYVSSLHDGMNLVAKEFVAARDDEAGVLVLSQFTGASREMTEALIVNPYDLRQASDALDAALRMSLSEQRTRMKSMRRLLSEFNVYHWAGRMLVDAAEVRRRDRLTGLLSQTGAEVPHLG